jgi:hypothetical protein
VVDTLGGTITYESHADVLATLTEIERRAYEAGARKVWKKDRFENPSDGYKDVRVNIQRADGLVTELLLTTRAMHEAKMGPGHDLYEAKQLVDLFLEKGEGTPAQREEAEELSKILKKASKDLYGSTGPQSSSKASLSSIVEPLDKISALRSLVDSSVYPKLESLLGSIRKSLPLVEKAYGTSSYSKNSSTNMGSLAVPISQPALVGSLPSANRIISGTEAPPSVSSNITPSAPKGKSGPAVWGRETTIIIEGQPKEAARYEARESAYRFGLTTFGCGAGSFHPNKDRPGAPNSENAGGYPQKKCHKVLDIIMRVQLRELKLLLSYLPLGQVEDYI